MLNKADKQHETIKDAAQQEQRNKKQQRLSKQLDMCVGNIVLQVQCIWNSTDAVLRLQQQESTGHNIRKANTDISGYLFHDAWR